MIVAPIILTSILGWSLWRRAFGGWWIMESRWMVTGACILFCAAIGYYVVSLYTAPFWAAIVAVGFSAAVTLYWCCDHEPEGPTWWSVCRYLGPVGLSWALARKIWRDWMYHPTINACPGVLGEWIAGAVFGLFFGLALVALI